MPRMTISNIRLWLRGTRPKTLPASIAPVVVGAAAAWSVLSRYDGWGLRCIAADEGVWMDMESGYGPCATPWYAIGGALPRFLGVTLLCAGVALFLQIAVNFANDYSDGIRGTDAHRAGDESGTGKPQRLVASGRVKPKAVLAAAGAFALLACVCGLAVAVISHQYWFIAVGVACLLAGWFYTGGRHPYGYAGLGELFVFVFFGLVATLGTQYAICQSLDGLGIPNAAVIDFAAPGDGSEWSWVWFGQGQFGISGTGIHAAVCVGLNAVMLLMVNNMRDIDDDRLHGKRTLAVRLGERGSRAALAVCCAVDWMASILVMMMTWLPWGLVPWLAFAVTTVAMLRAVARRDFGRALGAAGMQTLVFAVVVALNVVAAGDGW
ncbi:1,4-dihydroxy-2-naphthoate octaprenyltransferase [Bifidobacterium sp. SMB2]|uniref:1,4-dihydroxy-2-naphthoate octaprenyltransferase n=2 Tax=Bifidobacterium TaxID=1678 RepID=A0ABX0C7X3_9BIFI|nr:1,4-dihydroxy-2-naphthoate octaprenyltransferase [Bifidobacterium sp. SMB2]NEH11258.1 1,4-dihydroxy-2-naphthoate octaprenyltransferase [Bifidobacterium saimiriisciurei]